MARRRRIQENLKAAAKTGDINGLYGAIKEDPNVLDRIDAIPFVDTPLHAAASAAASVTISAAASPVASVTTSPVDSTTSAAASPDASARQIDFVVEILRLRPSFGRKLNPEGQSSLHLALLHDKFDMVKRLIKLDKELIRVKGKHGETPLHFIAKKEIRANQEQSELDKKRADILAEFLFACPNSIEDLTNRDESALHIAVRTKNLSAVKIILGLIHRVNKRTLLAIKDDKGKTALHLAVENSQQEMVKLLEKHTALDVAERLDRRNDAIGNTSRDAGALKGSSPDKNDHNLAEFLKSPEKPLEELYKHKFFWGRSVSMELRNIGLVVAVLIATATFTAVLSPPGGVGGGDFNLLTNGGNFNVTFMSTNKKFAANTSFINATLSIPTHNPIKRPLFNDVNFHKLTYGYAFVLFYVLNTLAFIFSTAMIMFVLPGKPIFFLLHGALCCMMISYGYSFYLISPSFVYCKMYSSPSTICAGLIYIFRITMYVIELVSKTKRRIPSWFVSNLHSERLVMLNHLLAGQ